MSAPEAQPAGTEKPKRPLTAREKTRLNHLPQNDPMLGTVLGGHYEVLECIGRGGMSVVYKTRHQLINQLRAVKILLPHRDAAADFLLRFQLEATAASRLDNNHIVRVHDFVSPPDSAPYLVMDYAEGPDLGFEIDRLGRLPVKRAVAIFEQLLEAITHTHSRGVIHRDLKPDNILLVNDEIGGPDYVKLIDFGIAKLTAADKLQPQGLTPTGEVFGSPQYMSPEQCAGIVMDGRSEVYSLGCMFYEMLSGRAPLLGKSVLETLNMQAHTPATPLSKLVLDPPLKLPPGLDEIVMKCLAKKPDDRYQSTTELADALIKIRPFSLGNWQGMAAKPGVKSLVLTTIGGCLFLSFFMGFGLAKVFTNEMPLLQKDALATAESNAASPVVQENEWLAQALPGEQALDRGELEEASTKLEAALTRANSLNDGQKRSAATGIDLASLNLIKQFKNAKQGDLETPVAISDAYPNHPWDTKINGLLGALHDTPSKAMFKSTVDLFEDNHKGDLTRLNGVIKLAGETFAAMPDLSVRDKLRLAVAIAGVQDQQGYYDRARNTLENHAGDLAALGEYDPLVARYYLLQARVSLEDGLLEPAAQASEKAKKIYGENEQEHMAELLDLASINSDIALAKKEDINSLNIAKQALANLEQNPPAQLSDRVLWLRGKLALRVSAFEPVGNVDAIQKDVERALDQAERSVPKDPNNLIGSLTVADGLQTLKAVKAAASTKPMLWRAMTLAMTNGQMAVTSTLMKPLLASYDTPLTQKELLKLASNRLAIDKTLAAAGNKNEAAILEDYVVLGEALEDFSLGAARNLPKAKEYLDKASEMVIKSENHTDHLITARVYFYQARCARERKVTPSMVDYFLDRARKELDAAKEQQQTVNKEKGQESISATYKKIQELEQAEKHNQPAVAP